MSKAHDMAMRAAEQRVVEQRGFTAASRPRRVKKDFGDDFPVEDNRTVWTMVAAVAVIVTMIIVDACK